MELATFYLRQGQNTKAVEAAEKARNLDPQSIQTRMMLAGLYSSLKQTDRAIAEYRAVLDLDPNQQKARLWLASLYAAQSRYEEAREVLNVLVQPFFRSKQSASIEPNL